MAMSMFISTLKKEVEEAYIAGLRPEQLCSLMYITSEEENAWVWRANAAATRRNYTVLQEGVTDTPGTRESARAAVVSGDKDKQRRQMNDFRGKPNGHKC